MPISTVTLSTSAIPGPSSPIGLNWRGGRSVLWQITTNSSVAVGDFTLQWTPNDLQLSAYSTIYPPVGSPTLGTSQVWWTALSSTPYTTVSTSGSAGIHFTSSTIWPDGISGTFLAPPGALRLYSSANSSSILVLSVVQGDGG